MSVKIEYRTRKNLTVKSLEIKTFIDNVVPFFETMKGTEETRLFLKFHPDFAKVLEMLE